jgi:hypothetical protein
MESGISQGGMAEVLLRFGLNRNLCQDMGVGQYIALFSLPPAGFQMDPFR